MEYRHLPSVDRLVQATVRALDGAEIPRSLIVEVAREALEQARHAIAGAQPAPELEQLTDTVVKQVSEWLRPSLRPVINASGVILQTNLGRAPLSAAALAAMQAVGRGYSNLEYDLEAGERGSRYTHVRSLLSRLSGAEDALAVNNNAAAIYLVLQVLASGREVIVSRGQAVEIGGGFRIPDVLRQSGAGLVEVGTTNRTYISDYESAINERTALLLRVHSSNFRLVGFVHETPLEELAELSRKRQVTLLDDLGSGTLLSTSQYGLAPEPMVQQSVAAGVDLVSFSGDKLLGGPQAGLIVGRSELVARLRKHPLARALRVDKTTIAGLEATLLAYLRGTAMQELPIWRMISTPLAELQSRAAALLERLAAAGLRLETHRCASTVGGGSLPGETLPSVALAITRPDLDGLARRLRLGEAAVIGRIAEGRLLLDLRTVLAEQEEALCSALLAAV